MNTILCIAIPTPLRQIFHYLLPPTISPDNLITGMRVRVSFGKRKVVGILVAIVNHSDFPHNKLKYIDEILDTQPTITPSVLKLCHWLSDYYHHPLGETLAMATPASLRKIKNVARKNLCANNSNDNIENKNLDLNENIRNKDFCSLHNYPTLNSAQQSAINKIKPVLNDFNCFLLNGVTGSGKTEIYLQIIEQLITQQKQALVLVPEIGLTPQILQRLQERFSSANIINFHSSLTDREKLIAWQAAKNGSAQIIVGTRSAIFMPCLQLGIIIVDEEHDMSFKQQEGLRYSARDLAIVRANFEKIPVILGSATPSLESYHNAITTRYHALYLPERAGTALHPIYNIIDLRTQSLQHGLSKPLITSIKQHLKNNNQVLIFLNRRGFAPVLMCQHCGWTAKCSRCEVPLTFHAETNHLHCHHCDRQQANILNCEQCGQPKLQLIGVGTERIEHALQKLFPSVPVVRIDRDSTRKKQSMNNILANIMEGNPQILIGTQMLSKGHHFPKVTLVGVINADSGFFSTDFRATERLGQLLIQVAGRSGRADHAGEVVIQTHQPQHPLLLTLINHGYNQFASMILAEREQHRLPPFSHLALFRAESLQQPLTINFLTQVKELLVNNLPKTLAIELFGPITSPMPKRQARYRCQLLIQTNHRGELHKLLTNTLPLIEKIKISNKVRWSLDVDPMEMG